MRQPFKYTMSFVETRSDRSTKRRAGATRSGVKYPRSTPSFSESFVSIVDDVENSMNRAKSAGRKRPNPSAMFFVIDAAESRIWSRNLKSFEAGPVSVNAYTSRFNSSAICQASRSSNRLTTMRFCLTRPVPPPFRFLRTTNERRSLPNVEREGEASRTANEEAKPPERTGAAPRTRRRNLPNGERRTSRRSLPNEERRTKRRSLPNEERRTERRSFPNDEAQPPERRGAASRTANGQRRPT